MTIDSFASTSQALAQRPSPGGTTPLAIQVRDLEKSFRIPTHRIDSFKERIVRPFAARDYRELHALDGISFDIEQGEFFGIVGRNGSGKSTLLKLLASIYRADAGTIRMAGRLAPFIELGVGFNMELTARENVVLNGVMMGLTPKETRRKLDAVIDFAELSEFAELKLKNYSSGMLVRLAFSVMIQADADILLIDEVLAVGDAAFQQKCADAFREMKAVGKTIVLVTHEMSTVEEYCHRAMLIDGGKIQQVGDPAEVGRRYLRLNFEDKRTTGDSGSPERAGEGVRIVDAWIKDAHGARTTTVEHGQSIALQIEIEATKDLDTGLDVGFIISNADGVGIFQFGTLIATADGVPRPLSEGERATVRFNLDNPLAAGRYFVDLGLNQALSSRVLLYVPNAVNFVVFGGAGGRGIVELGHTVETLVDEPRT